MKKIAAFVLVAFALAGCSSSEKVDPAQEFIRDESSLAVAQRHATVHCEQADCDVAWTLTKRYIEQYSDTSVTHADAFDIATEVPRSSGSPAYSATRVPKGAGATLTLFAQCPGMYGTDNAKGSDYDSCAAKIIKIQNGYAAFLRAHAADR